MAAVETSLAGRAVQRAQLDDGLEFHYAEAGSGRPVVFVHGGAGDYTTWDPQWAAFSARYRAISYSRRFSQPNRNPDPPPDHSALAEARDLAGLLVHWGAAPAVLVAASYGAFTSLALAVQRPDLVQALVLVEPAMLAWARLAPHGEEVLQSFMNEVRRPAGDAFRRGEDARAMQILALGISGAATPVLADDPAMAKRLRNVRAMRILTLSDDEFPMIEPAAIAAIRAPTLLVSGANTEPLLRVVFEQIARHMPAARVAVLPDAGHAVAREQPAAFNRAALDFLRDQGLD